MGRQLADRKQVFRDELAAQGFIKTSREAGPSISSQQRTVLVRKGNELFNKGQIEQAKRIFLTAWYTDGLIRIGNYYEEQNKPLEAFRMYWLAPERRKVDYLVERMAGVIREWLREENANE